MFLCQFDCVCVKHKTKHLDQIKLFVLFVSKLFSFTKLNVYTCLNIIFFYDKHKFCNKQKKKMLNCVYLFRFANILLPNQGALYIAHALSKDIQCCSFIVPLPRNKNQHKGVLLTEYKHTHTHTYICNTHSASDWEYVRPDRRHLFIYIYV